MAKRSQPPAAVDSAPAKPASGADAATSVSTADPAAGDDTSGLPSGFDELINQVLPDEQDQTDPNAPDPNDERARADAIRIERFEAEQKFPEFIKVVVEEMQKLRQYIHTDCMVPRTVNSVAMNRLLRNQYIREGQVFAKNPDLAVQPRKTLAPMPPNLPVLPPGDPAMDQAMAQAQQAAQEMLAYDQAVKVLAQVGKTAEIVVKHQMDNAELGRLMQGIIQDTGTDGISWVKVTWRESLGHDPLGVQRNDDFQDQINRLAFLSKSFAEGDFTETDEEYSEYLDLGDSVRQQVAAESWAKKTYGDAPPLQQETTEAPNDSRTAAWESGGERVPLIEEIPRFRSFAVDPINPEDIRIDWSVTRPEEFRKARHIAHRGWMTWDEIGAMFGLTEAQVKDYKSQPGSTGKSNVDDRVPGPSAPDQVKRDPRDLVGGLESTEQNGKVAIWERWDRDANRRYVWVAGCRKFLINEVPSVVSKFWYPFFPLYWNRVTGRFMPVSDAKLQKPFNEEYNLLRSHDRQARRAGYNKYIVARNTLSADEKEKLESCPPEGVIEIRKAREVSKFLQTVIGSNYKPELYDTTRVMRDLDEISNIPSSARGDTGDTKFATSDQIANQTMNEQADRYKACVEMFLTDICTHMLDIDFQVMPAANVKAIAGPGAVWPEIDRETLWQNLQLEIIAGSTGKPDQQRKLDLLKSAAEIMQMLGIGGPTSTYEMDAKKIWGDILDAQNLRGDPENYLIKRQPMPMMPPGPNQGGPGGPGGAPIPPPGAKPGSPVPPPGGAVPNLIPGGAP